MPLAAATLRFVGEGVGVGVGDGVGLGEGVGLGDGDGVGLGVPPLNVTVSSALLPAVPWQGFVVPEQVKLVQLMGLLQPPNVDPPLAVALNVITAALSVVLIFGEHSPVTV
jgi:hypothetical protein